MSHQCNHIILSTVVQSLPPEATDPSHIQAINKLKIMKTSSSDAGLPIYSKVAAAGLAGMTADLCTYPLDTIKVWLMVRKTGSETVEAAVPKSPAPKMVTTRTKSLVAPTSKMRKVIKVIRHGTLAKSSLSSSVQPIVKKLIPIEKSKKRVVLKDGTTKKITVTKLAQSKYNPKSSVSAKQNVKHMHIAANQGKQSIPKMGAISVIRQNIAANGFKGLYGGITAGLQRQVAFCAVRIGCYDSIKGFYSNLLPASPDSKQIPQRILAGTTSAMLAVTMFQPTDVVKIRMQAQTGMPPEMRRYKNSFQAYRHLYNGGFTEAWRGLKANQFRLAVVNVSELVTYDVAKDTLIGSKLMEDNSSCHFVSAALAGLFTTLVASPIDVVKTRLMNSPGGSGTIFSVAKTMLFKEGITSFYKGVLPSYLRLGSWNIVMFMSYEQYKKAFQPTWIREDITLEPRVVKPMLPTTQTVSCEIAKPRATNC